MTVCDCVEGCQLADRFTPATREILVFTKSKKRYFDLDAVREPFKPHGGLATGPKRKAKTDGGWSTLGDWTDPNPAGAPPLDWWNLPWEQVHNRLVRAMVPEKVCRVCGEPSRRIIGDVRYVPSTNPNTQSSKAYANASAAWDSGVAVGKGAHSSKPDGGRVRQAETIGFSDCGHNSWRPGVVLDPFQPGDEMTATFYVGDAIETLNKLPENSVDLILTSPPFLALRSYLPADHPDKALEGGSQATPGAFIDWLIDVVEACDRVLAPHGSMCIELGDTYSGSTADGGDNRGNERYPAGRSFVVGQRSTKEGWPLAKSLSLIPELFRLTLVYGTNPLTGRTTDRWRLRNVVRWVRPNPPVGALGDKFRPATSELMVFCKSAKRYFDLDAVREAFKSPETHQTTNYNQGGNKPGATWGNRMPTREMTHSGAPPLDWWNIPPGGYEGAHYAVFPPELCIKPIKAMCPEKVCKVCGEPSRRIVGETEYHSTNGGRVVLNMQEGERLAEGVNQWKGPQGRPGHYVASAPTLGFSDCGHDDWRPGLVLDPFGGSGTTALVATGHGRDCILIDLDERNFDLALQRVGPFILERGEL